MNTDAQTNWPTLTAVQRNALVGETMKAEPLYAYYVRWIGKNLAQLRVKEESEAQSWLRIAKFSKENWKRLMDEVPWSLREEVSVHVESWHIRYSDTPGGGWIVIEWLRARGLVCVSSCSDGWHVAFDDRHPHHGLTVEEAPTMAEAACLVALRVSSPSASSAQSAVKI